MEVILKGGADEIAALVVAIQERRDAQKPTDTISRETICGGSFEGHVNKPVFMGSDSNTQTCESQRQNQMSQGVI